MSRTPDDSRDGRARAGSWAEPGFHTRTEDGYRLLFEHMESMVCTLDGEGRFTAVNRAGERLTGYAASELLGKHAVELIAPGRRSDAVREFGRRLAESGDLSPAESLLVTRDGREIPIEVTSSLLFEDGEPVGALGVVVDVSGRKSTEEALAHSEERFRSAFSGAAIGMALVAPDGRWIQVNDALCEIVGYAPERLLEMSFQDVTFPDDLEADLDSARRLLAGEIEKYQMEKRYVHADGRLVWILLSVSLVRDKGGKPLYFVSQVQDIDEQKRARESLARSEARLAEAQELARLGSWEWDVTADVVTWSEELYRIFGIEPGTELSYESFLERVDPRDRELAEQTVGRALESGEPYGFEFRIAATDGPVRWISSRGEVEVCDGQPVRMRGTAQEVTEHREVEDRLREAERRYRTLVEQLPLVTYVRPLEMDGSNLYVSPQVEELLGATPDEWLSNPGLLAEIIHPDDVERVLACGEDVRATGVPVRQEYRYVRRDGRIVWVLDETNVVRDPDGEPVAVQGFLVDITERKLAEEEGSRLREELHHSQKLEALGRLAGGIAHDFNNMLTAIRGYSALLLDTFDADDEGRRVAEQIGRAAEQAAVLPRQLLAFAHKQVLQPRVVDLDDVVGASAELLQAAVGELISVDVAPGSCARVLADPGQMEQTLLNLALNARDAMPGGGTLSIATRTELVPDALASELEVAPGTYAVVSVRDTGQGMDEETRARAFDPFFTTKGPGQGSGLGLSTVYGAIRQSGGLVRVESEPGRGSCFEILLPCVTADVEAEPDDHLVEQAGDRGGAEHHGITVLLVEDEELVRDLATITLERAGHRVLAVSGPREALEICDSGEERVDVLVTDVVMTVMRGPELAGEVRARFPAAAVVLLSGYADEAQRLGTPEHGRRFLAKPFSPSELVDAVADVVRDGGVDRVELAATGNGSSGSAPRVTCVVADDHPAVLDSVSRYLERNGFEVVARVSRGDDALAEIAARRPSIALLDVGMAPLSGVEVARKVAETLPHCRSILYTGQRDGALLEEALEAGAHGFVLKEAPLGELMRALEIVARGGVYVDPELSGALASGRAVASLSPLTAREREVLGLVADGMTNERAGGALGISPETVQSHVRNAMSKLEADTRTQAVATAIRQSLIT